MQRERLARAWREPAPHRSKIRILLNHPVLPCPPVIERGGHRRRIRPRRRTHAHTDITRVQPGGRVADKSNERGRAPVRGALRVVATVFSVVQPVAREEDRPAEEVRERVRPGLVRADGLGVVHHVREQLHVFGSDFEANFELVWRWKDGG